MGVTGERCTYRRILTSLFAATALVVGIVATSAGATTRKTTVAIPGGTVTNASNFTVRAVTKHPRSLTLKLSYQPPCYCARGRQGSAFIGSGRVTVTDGFSACRSHVRVEIQYLKNLKSSWETVGRYLTSRQGKYKKLLINLPGKYRAKAKRQVLNGGNDICVAATSARVGNPHGG